MFRISRSRRYKTYTIVILNWLTGTRHSFCQMAMDLLPFCVDYFLSSVTDTTVSGLDYERHRGVSYKKKELLYLRWHLGGVHVVHLFSFPRVLWCLFWLYSFVLCIVLNIASVSGLSVFSNVNLLMLNAVFCIYIF